jgi:predicted peroxiredoxin
MRNLINAVTLVCLLAFPGSGYSSENSKNLLVIVTTNDPVTQLMSMVLATQSQEKGANVEVLLCGKAGDLAVRGSQEVFLKPKNTSPQMLLKNLIDSGIKVEICPPYLPNAQKTAEDLIDGVSVAKPPEVADRLLDDNTKILSY